jgi:general L-amino acid transport system substrate-binding protein
MEKNMRKLSVLIIMSILSVLMIGVVGAQDVQVGPITQAILDRGSLNCGTNATLQGFGFQNDVGDYSGYDVDTCRAVAAAVLGDADAVTFRATIASERQAVLQSGEIDMMARNTTFTLSRDVQWGVIFGPTTFYDGQGVMTLTELGVASIAELDGSTMCVQAGTTTELNIGDYVGGLGLDIEILTFPDNPATTAAYVEGRCESLTTDKSGLASIRASQPDPGAHIILPETISKEPLGPLSPQSDPQFSQIVAWTVYCQIQAEEWGVTSENVQDVIGSSENANLLRMFGQGDEVSGDYLGIANDFCVHVIEQVGNFGEVYDRNLGPLGLTREGSVNALWSDGGMIYSPPFR